VKKVYKSSEADRARNKAYYEANREKIIARSNAYNKAYREANKEEIRAQMKDRYTSDISFKLLKLAKTAHWRMTGKSIKDQEIIDLLGCTLEEYKDYLESKFQEGMTWENHTVEGWHIDHILPLKESKLSQEEKLKRLHYTNTQPLWAKDNISKGNKTVYNPED